MKNDGLYNTLELGCNFLLFLEIPKVTDTKSEPVQDMIVNWQFFFWGKLTVILLYIMSQIKLCIILNDCCVVCI